jgi:hypothetical protein
LIAAAVSLPGTQDQDSGKGALEIRCVVDEVRAGTAATVGDPLHDV